MEDYLSCCISKCNLRFIILFAISRTLLTVPGHKVQIEFQAILTAVERKQLPADFEALLGPLWDNGNQRFNTQETYVLDFKETVPSNFDEDYGIGILRLALGFYNSFGGAIVFGVRDQHLDIVGTNSWFDIETFNRTLTELAGMRAECLVKTYTVLIGSELKTITVVLVPKRDMKWTPEIGPNVKV